MRSLLLIIALTMSVAAEAQEEQELTISEFQNSGCLKNTRASADQRIPTVKLVKEGNTLSVELLNYEENCGLEDFLVNAKVSEGKDNEPCSVSVNVTPVVPRSMDCECPFNVSFVVRDLEANSFYLKCWWYEGLVELTEGEPLVFEDIYEDVTIDGLNYTLRMALHKAMLRKSNWEGELSIPSEVSYEGQTFSVVSMIWNTFLDNIALTKVIIPKSIRGSSFYDTGFIFSLNPFFACTALESIEVEEENPVMYAVDGVLFNKDKTILIGYPAASRRISYTVPDGVTEISDYAFCNSQYLKSISLPESVKRIGLKSFSGCKMDELYIRGILDPKWMSSSIFSGMDTMTKVYVLPSEVEKFKAIYEGPVFPLQDSQNGISNIISPISKSSELFDLQGRHVYGEPARGLYIQNGKKVLK